MTIIRAFLAAVLCLGISLGEASAQEAKTKANKAAGSDSKKQAPKSGKRKAVKKSGGGKVGKIAGQRTLVDALDEQVPLEVGTQLRIFKQARLRRAEIERLEGELDRRAARLKGMIAKVEKRYKTLRMIQAELVALSKEQQDEGNDAAGGAAPKTEKSRNEKVAKLAKVFDKMKAGDAAKMIPAMDLPLVVEVISRLKPKQSAKILSKIEPQKAAEITGLMTATKRGKKRR